MISDLSSDFKTHKYLRHMFPFALHLISLMSEEKTNWDIEISSVSFPSKVKHCPKNRRTSKPSPENNLHLKLFSNPVQSFDLSSGWRRDRGATESKKCSIRAYNWTVTHLQLSEERGRWCNWRKPKSVQAVQLFLRLFKTDWDDTNS